jgi:hypothetical protein
LQQWHPLDHYQRASLVRSIQEWMTFLIMATKLLGYAQRIEVGPRREIPKPY